MSVPVQREELATLQFLIANYFPTKDAAQAQAVLSRLAAAAAIETQGVMENRCIAELRAYASANPGTYIFPRWNGLRVAKYLASAPPAPQAKPQPLSDEQLKQLLAAEYNRGWADCEATHDGP